jgi:hypothetical protein
MDIDARDVAPRPEICPPHFEAPAAQHADLDEMHISVDELLQMAMINVEIMVPLE